MSRSSISSRGQPDVGPQESLLGKSAQELGLAVARRFIEDHGGRIELLPDGPGARFRIRMPLLPGPQPAVVR